MKLKFILFITILFLSASFANAQNPLLGKWKVISIAANKKVVKDFGDKEIFVNFDKTRLSGQVCNSFNGNYSIVKNKLKISNLATTLMACENMETERMLLDVLDKNVNFSISKGVLTLKNKKLGATARLERAKPATAIDLIGKWQLNSMSIKGTSIELGEKPATLNVEKDKIGGNSGCNAYGGSLSLKGSTLKISQIFSTKMFCEGVPESEYFQALESVKTFEIKNNRLILMDAKKQNQLIFEKLEK